jgi:hypothetical protein
MISKWYEYPYWLVPPGAAHHWAFPLLGQRFVTMTVMDWPEAPPAPQEEHGAFPVDVRV